MVTTMPTTNPSNLSAPTQGDSPLVIVLHGLHQTPWFMTPLVKTLKGANYRTYAHRYHSLKDDIGTHSERLHQHLRASIDPNTRLHIVAHSLGGLVARHFIANHPSWRVDKVVTLGTPHLGSVTADYVKRLTPALVGNAYTHALDGTCLALPDGVALGVIAGNKPFGVGQLFLNYHNRTALKYQEHDNDGTVYVFETRLPNACDHLILPATHTGLVHDPVAHQQILYFLAHGRFLH